MKDRASPLWYDGATRDRGDALERIERDALTFIARAVDDFEGDDSAWLLLLTRLVIPAHLDGLDERTFARGYAIRVTADHVILGLSDRLPRQLEAIHAALVTQPWCLAAELGVGSIVLRVRGLDIADETRISGELTSRAEAVSGLLKRGVASLVGVAAPDELPRVELTLQAALHRIEVIASAKLGRLKAARASA